MINPDAHNFKSNTAIKFFFETYKISIITTVIIMLFAIGITVGYIADMKNEELNDIQSRREVDKKMTDTSTFRF